MLKIVKFIKRLLNKYNTLCLIRKDIFSLKCRYSYLNNKFCFSPNGMPETYPMRLVRDPVTRYQHVLSGLLLKQKGNKHLQALAQ